MSRYIEFVECGFKNIFRYGANWTVFKFNSGLTNVFGKNGIGKSTILEALHYCLFGESYRGLTLAKLINRSNKKNFEIYLIIKIVSNGKEVTYKILRGLDPKIEQLYILGDPKPIDINGRFNKYIIDNLLGFDANINKKVISVNPKNNSFTTMSLDERRKVIDSIVNLSKTKEYLKNIKDKLNEEATKKTILISDIDFNKRSTEPYEIMIAKNDIDKDSKINAIDSSILKCKKEQEDNNVKLVELNDGLSDLDENINKLLKEEADLKSVYLSKNPKELNNKLIKLKSSLLYIKNKAKDKKNEISKIIPNTICSHCGNSYTVDQANDKRREETIEYNKILEDGRKVNDELKSLNDEINALTKEYDNISKLTNEIMNLKDKKNQKVYEIRIIEQQNLLSTRSIGELSENRLELLKDNTNIDSIKNKLAEINKNKIKLDVQLAEINKNIDNLSYSAKMFSDTGLKSLILRKFLPILNKLINFYLKKFELNITFNITEDYKYNIIAGNEYSDDFDGLSGGQQQRINLAILFAQTDLIKLIGNFKTNLLFLDEYIDGGVDDEGLNATIKILKQICLKDNKSIVLISHKLNANIIKELDYFYHAKKINDNFSELVEVDSSYTSEILREN